MMMISRDEFSVQLKMTGDGSQTLYVPELNEHYHSIHGAVNESRHIFIGAGLNFMSRYSDKLNILEIGLGTGLNALLTCIEANKNNLFIDYSAIELYPLKAELYLKLNYDELLQDQNIKEIFVKLHKCQWEEKVSFSKYFSLRKMKTSLDNYLPANQYFDLVYFDAFGPDVQPEMWTLQVFQKLAAGMKRGGVLVTYSTKGTVKRNIKEAGFSIEKLPGPIGKCEILRAKLKESL